MCGRSLPTTSAAVLDKRDRQRVDQMGQGLWCRPFSHPTQLYPNERHLKVDEENDRFRAWMGYLSAGIVDIQAGRTLHNLANILGFQFVRTLYTRLRVLL